MIVGYQLHAWLAAQGAEAGRAFPEGLAAATLHHAAAALVAGYGCALLAGQASTRTARLLGIALAAIAGLAAFQRLEQALPLLSVHVAQVVASPACLLGAAWLERHRALWVARRSRLARG